MKVFWLRQKIEKLKKELENLRAKDAEFEKREEELKGAIEDAAAAEGDDAAEKQQIIDEEVEKFDAEKKEHEEAKNKLEEEIAGMEDELKKEEEAQDTTPAAPAPAEEATDENRGGIHIMTTRAKMFTEKIRSALFNEKGESINEQVKAWLGEIRSCIREKRELSNVGLTIPEVFLGILKENMINYSKLYKYLDVRALGGNGRLVVQGKIAEAIWTECCANINELSLAFNQVEVNCFKIAGFYQVCNATLEDSDIDLSATILEAIGQSIGLGIDKAVLYGRNSNKTQKMPLGVVTRLAQTSEPADYPATARPWEDLHTSNIITLAAGLAGAALFKQILLASGAMKGDYARGPRVWIMNEKTHTKLMAETVVNTADGQFVASASGSMPAVGGTIEVLNFIPDNTIIAGYFDLYLLAERAGQKFAQSEHVKFLEDATVFKGTARYDGQPTIAEAFIAIGLENTTPGTTMAFAPDTANVVTAILMTETAEVDVDDTLQLVAKTFPVDGPITWSSSDSTKATVSTTGLVTGKASGTAVITAVSGSASASCTVTVNV